MCMECGGRCMLCGEPSVYIHEAPLGALPYIMEWYSCAEHDAEVQKIACASLERRMAARWN